MMYFWKWTAFVPASAGPLGVGGGKVLLHFFPGALGISAPYPVQTAVELFSNGKVLARQSFDGLRLNQPDGVELARIFPELPEMFGNGMGGSEIGMNIQLGTAQQRVDLGLSRVMVELVYPSHRVRYHAASVHEAGAAPSDAELKRRIYPDPTFRSSLVEVDPFPAAIQEAAPQELEIEEVEQELPPEPVSGGYQISTREVVEPLVLSDNVSPNLEESPPARFLTQYEVTSSLPISVRCL